MNAPERVWVEFRNPFVDIARWHSDKRWEPYIRADLYDAQAAEIADLRRQLAEAQAENFRLKDRVHRLQRSYMEGPNE